MNSCPTQTHPLINNIHINNRIRKAQEILRYLQCICTFHLSRDTFPLKFPASATFQTSQRESRYLMGSICVFQLLFYFMLGINICISISSHTHSFTIQQPSVFLPPALYKDLKTSWLSGHFSRSICGPVTTSSMDITWFVELFLFHPFMRIKNNTELFRSASMKRLWHYSLIIYYSHYVNVNRK